jgi:hypothetical protein
MGCENGFGLSSPGWLPRVSESFWGQTCLAHPTLGRGLAMSSVTNFNVHRCFANGCHNGDNSFIHHWQSSWKVLCHHMSIANQKLHARHRHASTLPVSKNCHAQASSAFLLHRMGMLEWQSM